MSQELMKALFERDLSVAEMDQIAAALKVDPQAAEQLAALAQAHYRGLGLKPARLAKALSGKLWGLLGLGLIVGALCVQAMKPAPQIEPSNTLPATQAQVAGKPRSQRVQVEATPALPAAARPTASEEGDQMSVEVALPKAMVVRVDLFDTQGKRLRSLFDGKAPQGTNRFEFDGKDKNGQSLPVGRYRVVVDYGGGQLEKWFETK
jgi:hypothetical protein